MSLSFTKLRFSTTIENLLPVHFQLTTICRYYHLTTSTTLIIIVIERNEFSANRVVPESTYFVSFFSFLFLLTINIMYYNIFIEETDFTTVSIMLKRAIRFFYFFVKYGRISSDKVNNLLNSFTDSLI